MKGKGILLLVGAVILGVMFGPQLTAALTGAQPKGGTPSVDDVNSGADKATDAAKGAGDIINGLSDQTLKWIVIGVGVAIIIYTFKRRPAFRYGIIGAVIMLSLLVIFF